MSVSAGFFYAGNLWVTDGTDTGTQEVSTFDDPSFPLVAFAGGLLFVDELSADYDYADGLGVTDGSAADTTLIIPVSDADGGSYNLFDATTIGPLVIGEIDFGTALLITNGTSSGTTALTSPALAAPYAWFIDSALYTIGSRVIFSATSVNSTDSGEVYGLWVSNGTSAGTLPVTVSNASPSGLDPGSFTPLGGRSEIFTGYDSDGMEGLWVTDGTSDGTFEINTAALPAGSFVTGFLSLGSLVIFEGIGADAADSLWVTDGTSAGTQELMVPLPNSGGSTPNTNLDPVPLAALNGLGFFLGSDGQSNLGLWVTNGTAAGTVELATPTLNLDYTPSDFFVYGTEVLFEGEDASGEYGLWISDGTSAGTKEISPANAYSAGLLDYGNPGFALAGSGVVFKGADAAGNEGLWLTNGTAAGTYEITVAGASSSGSLSPVDLTSFVVPVPDTITISGTQGDQPVLTTSTLSPWSSVVITDTAPSQTETLTITLAAAGNGSLTNLGGGSYDASTGVYTASGTTTMVTDDIEGLVFVPTFNQVPPGQTVETNFFITDTDTSGATATDISTSVIATAVAIPPSMINNTDGTSYLYTYFPTTTVAETIADYSGPNATGTIISDVVDNTDGSALLYAYNPTSTVTQTASEYAATDSTDGAPAGAEISDVVDDADGTSLVYAYDPTSTVTQTTQYWSGTNATNGAPSGSEISDVIDDTDGTSLLFSYDPTATVTQTISEYSATNATNGAPSGSEISDVVDNADGTSVLYAYNPTSTVSQTATSYSSTDATSGAPAGAVTSETFDYTNGESAITIYGADNTSTTIDYSGPDGTGSVIPAITAADTVTTGAASIITVTGSNQLVDPGTGSFTIQFTASATADSVALHAGGSDQILGFSLAAGDTFDLASLLTETNVSMADATAHLSNYVSVAAVDGNAAIMFDPTGQAAGTRVALLIDGAGLVGQLQTLKAFQI